LQLAEQLVKDCAIVFTTAYPEFALKGFELNVTDYLLKPFSFDRFYTAMERVQQSLSHKQQHIAPSNLFIKTEYRLEKVALCNLKFIEGMGDYRRIHAAHKKIMTLQTFKELEDELKDTTVLRVHKSYMVNLEFIEGVERDRIRIGNELIPISETYRKGFYERLK